MSNTTFKPGRHFLQIPGPSNVPDSVLRAMAQPVIDHRGPDFPALTFNILEQIKPVFNTESPVLFIRLQGLEAGNAPY